MGDEGYPHEDRHGEEGWDMNQLVRIDEERSQIWSVKTRILKINSKWHFSCLELKYVSNNLGALPAQLRNFVYNYIYKYNHIDLYAFCVILGNR